MNEREYAQMYEVEDSHWWYTALHGLVLKTLEEEHRQKGELNILDAGCGTGRLCTLMQEFGQVVGCDFSDRALHYCRERGLVSLFKADLNSADLGMGIYDVITSIDVIYHRAIDDDAKVLEKFYQALRPGGVLVLNLVAFEFLRSTHDIAVHTRKRYTRNELLRLLKKQGFSIERASYRIAFLFIPVACYRLMKRFFPGRTDTNQILSDVNMPHPLINRLLFTITQMENRLMNHIRLPFGSSVYVVARRADI